MNASDMAKRVPVPNERCLSERAPDRHSSKWTFVTSNTTNKIWEVEIRFAT